MNSRTADAPVTAISTDDLLREDFWRAQFPALSMCRRLGNVKAVPGFDARRLGSLQERVIKEGYFDGHNEELAAKMPVLEGAVKHCVSLQLPPTFLFLFDEPWDCFYSLHPLIAHLLGEGYRVMPDFWIWHIDPAHHESGWNPHRDKGGYTLAADGSPLSLSLWIPVTDANPLNSCIYLLPADRDPVYNTPEEKNWKINLSDLRALPAKPGDFLGWTQAVLHWGSRSSPRATQPRISMALECQRGDIAAYNTPLITPFMNLDFRSRLKLVAKQILQYVYLYQPPPTVRALAERILAETP